MEKYQNSEREKRVSRLGSCDVAQRQSRHRSGFLSWSLQSATARRPLLAKWSTPLGSEPKKKKNEKKKPAKKWGKNYYKILRDAA